jgi:hypothetical protein
MLSVPSTPRACACVRVCVRACAGVAGALCAHAGVCLLAGIGVRRFSAWGRVRHVRSCVMCGVRVRVRGRKAVRAHCMTAFTSNGMGHGQPAGSSTKVGKPESGATPTHGASPYLHGMCTTPGHTHMHTHIQDHAQAQAHTHAHKHTHTRTHTRTHARTHTHTHT